MQYTMVVYNEHGIIKETRFSIFLNWLGQLDLVVQSRRTPGKLSQFQCC